MKLASVFVTGASIGVTVIYGLITAGIESVLHPLGVHASLGTQTLTSAWLAVVFSIIALLIWLITMCCCCFWRQTKVTMRMMLRARFASLEDWLLLAAKKGCGYVPSYRLKHVNSRHLTVLDTKILLNVHTFKLTKQTEIKSEQTQKIRVSSCSGQECGWEARKYISIGKCGELVESITQFYCMEQQL